MTKEIEEERDETNAGVEMVENQLESIMGELAKLQSDNEELL